MAFVLSAALALPFAGTALGSAGVFFLSRANAGPLRRLLSGFAAGVMAAASVWSLLLPAIERSAGMGKGAFVPALAGLLLGFWVFSCTEGLISRLERLPGDNGLLVAAVALHNLPEGMAVGAAAAAFLREGGISGGEVIALALGIALQNLPEGAVISMPLRASGMGRGRAFCWGVLSGVAEPLGAAAMVLLARLLLPALPLLLSFSAGAMLFVTAKELLPDAAEDPRAVNAFGLGFGLMMALDVALG